ncbi:MAG: branched-chain amino acid ABC transporter permease [Rhizobiaceae bacterium]
MMTVFGVPLAALAGQLALGLVNGCFYAILSLGLAVIFGMLNIVNFAHGAFFMLGAFTAWLSLAYLGLGYWWALLIAPVVVGLIGIVLEKTLIGRIAKLDHLYAFIMTLGIALMIQGVFRNYFGSTGAPYAPPPELAGGQDLGFVYLPNYRLWVMAVSLTVCFGTWFLIEKTKIGSYLRAATENPTLLEAFGVNVGVLITATYGVSVGLAAFAGVLAAPIYSVNPNMGADLIIVVFAVVVIGGLGSMMGAILTGLGLGVIEALTKVFYPEASTTVIFVVMAIILLTRPSGLFGR